MRVAVLGTGMVGTTLAGALGGLGHDVVLGTRDPEATRGRDGEGEPGAWLATHPEVAVAAYRDAVEGADLVVQATSGAVALDVVAAVGADALAGKVLLDVTNPLDFSGGFPPTLAVAGSDSLAEQIQRAAPQARVVKSLNTLTAALMVAPGALPEPTTVFVAGDDAEAKRLVTDLLTALGHQDVLDLGDLTAARGLEQWLPLWLRLLGALGTPAFNLRIVR